MVLEREASCCCMDQYSGSSSMGATVVPRLRVHRRDFDNEFQSSLWNMFRHQEFTDCTLVTSPLESLQVHRVVLSASSPYFRRIFSSHHDSAVIILHDVSFHILRMIVDFIYRGEVLAVSSEDVDDFLRTADSLQIEGLNKLEISQASIINEPFREAHPEVVAPMTTVTVTTPSPISTTSVINYGVQATNLSPSPQPPVVVQPPVIIGHCPTTSNLGNISNISSLATTATSQPTVNSSPVYSKKARLLEHRTRHSAEVTHTTSTINNNNNTTNDLNEEMKPLELSVKKSNKCESPVIMTSTPVTSPPPLQHSSPTLGSPSLPTTTASEPTTSVSFPSAGSVKEEESAMSIDVVPSKTASSPPSVPPPCSSSGGNNSSDEKDIICKFCGKGFSEVSNLIQHLPVHTGERPFKCEFCGKAFKLRHHMKDHARVHTGERPFKCSICGKNFSRSTILKAHEKTHFPKCDSSENSKIYKL